VQDRKNPIGGFVNFVLYLSCLNPIPHR